MSVCRIIFQPKIVAHMWLSTAFYILDLLRKWVISDRCQLPNTKSKLRTHRVKLSLENDERDKAKYDENGTQAHISEEMAGEVAWEVGDKEIKLCQNTSGWRKNVLQCLLTQSWLMELQPQDNAKGLYYRLF